jgi:hypothetical protein
MAEFWFVYCDALEIWMFYINRPEYSPTQPRFPVMARPPPSQGQALTGPSGQVRLADEKKKSLPDTGESVDASVPDQMARSSRAMTGGGVP